MTTRRSGIISFAGNQWRWSQCHLRDVLPHAHGRANPLLYFARTNDNSDWEVIGIQTFKEMEEAIKENQLEKN